MAFRPESSNVVTRRDLFEMLVEYNTSLAKDLFIADRVAPQVRVPMCDGRYGIFNRENLKKREETKRASSGAYNRITGDFGQATFSCEERGLEFPIDDRERKKYALLIDAEAAATETLWFKMLLEREFLISQLYANAAFTENAPTTIWSTSATAVPITDLEAGIIKLRQNSGAARSQISLIMTETDKTEFLATAQVIAKSSAAFFGILPWELSAVQIAGMLEIKEVIIPQSSYDSAEEGVSESISEFWASGAVYLGVHAEPNSKLQTPSVARTVLWEEDTDMLPLIESYRDDTVRADIVRTRMDTDEILMGDTPDLFAYKLTT